MTTVRHAQGKDLEYINNLALKETHALGFLPKSKYESIALKLERKRSGKDEKPWRYQWLLVCEDNGDQTGFILVGFGSRYAKERYATVAQIVIQEDARRWLRASKLLKEVELEALQRGCIGVKARVAMDLESNLFWQGMGYSIGGETTSTRYNTGPSKSQRPLWVYIKEFGQQLSLFDTSLQIPENEVIRGYGIIQAASGIAVGG